MSHRSTERATLLPARPFSRANRASHESFFATAPLGPRTTPRVPVAELLAEVEEDSASRGPSILKLERPAVGFPDATERRFDLRLWWNRPVEDPRSQTQRHYKLGSRSRHRHQLVMSVRVEIVTVSYEFPTIRRPECNLVPDPVPTGGSGRQVLEDHPTGKAFEDSSFEVLPREGRVTRGEVGQPSKDELERSVERDLNPIQ